MTSANAFYLVTDVAKLASPNIVFHSQKKQYDNVERFTLFQIVYFKGIKAGILPYIKWADVVLYTISTSICFHVVSILNCHEIFYYPICECILISRGF